MYLAYATQHLLNGITDAWECEEDSISLLQTDVHSKTYRQVVAVSKGPKSLEEIKTCISKVAEAKVVKERDIKVSDTELVSLVNIVKDCAGEYGMEKEEYLFFMQYVRDHAPQKLLVWGLGVDSIVLDLLNYGGETLFLEPDQNWIEILQEAAPGQTLHVVNFDENTFNTTVASYQEFLASPHRADTIGPLQGQPCWETVLVDSPMGGTGTATPSADVGRAVPMYTALADFTRCKTEGRYPENREVSLFVHDSNRPLEDNVAQALFGTDELKREVGPKKLRQYCVWSCSTSNSTAAAIDNLESIVDELSSSLGGD